jgi:flagellar biosynthesis/type III secretory pathway protein FliH
VIQDGPKRQGRFIKKGSTVAKNIALQEFPFAEINTLPTLSHDNSSRSIIHSTYHETVAIDAATKYPDKFDDDLGNPRDQRAVLVPLDFTADWERTKSMRRDRIKNSEDDDDFDYEAAMRAARMKADVGPAEGDEAASTAGGAASSAPAAAKAAEAAASAAEADDAVAAMQAAGFRFSKPPSEEEAEAAPVQQAAPQRPSPAPQRPAAPPVEPSVAATNELLGALNDQPSTFIPMAASEADVAEEYRRRLAQKEQDEKERVKLEEEAKARGYREGFRIGEEKGATFARQNAGALFGKVGELISELGNLRKLILDNVQDNFYEICQAMAEALFKREFTIHPETFAAVIKRAIEEAVEPGKIKVRVHPEMFERIAALGVKDLEPLLVKDASIDPSDFRVESEQAVVDASLSKIVADFLTQADLALVEEGSGGKREAS